MNFSEYQRLAARTSGSDLLPENQAKGLACAALGMCGEAGEFADIVKKVQHHGVPLDAAMIEKLRKEAGDQLWYIAHACSVMGWKMEDIASENIGKLRKRYPDGFSAEASVRRVDVKQP